MKKAILLLFSLLNIYLAAQSQNPVLNPGFESWIDNGVWEDPEFWGTPNPTTFVFAITVQMDSDAYEGNLAARLTSKGQGSTEVPGVMCTGILDVFANTCDGGFAVDKAYLYFTGYYKYAPIPGDSCYMKAILWKWNETMGQRDTVATAVFMNDSVDQYTQFIADFQYLSAEIPDSGQVIVSTTRNVLTPPIGSILLVDKIEFTNTVGMEDINDFDVKVFPNPADKTCYFNLPSSPGADEILIFDVTGRACLSHLITSFVTEIPVSDFPDGMFFYQILSAEKAVLKSGSIVVKH